MTLEVRGADGTWIPAQSPPQVETDGGSVVALRRQGILEANGIRARVVDPAMSHPGRLRIIKIRGRRATIEWSGRGYVTVSCPDVGYCHVEQMDWRLKSDLSDGDDREAQDHRWRAEMGRLAEAAIAHARSSIEPKMRRASRRG